MGATSSWEPKAWPWSVAVTGEQRAPAGWLLDQLYCTRKCSSGFVDYEPTDTALGKYAQAMPNRSRARENAAAKAKVQHAQGEAVWREGRCRPAPATESKEGRRGRSGGAAVERRRWPPAPRARQLASWPKMLRAGQLEPVEVGGCTSSLLRMSLHRRRAHSRVPPKDLEDEVAAAAVAEALRGGRRRPRRSQAGPEPTGPGLQLSAAATVARRAGAGYPSNVGTIRIRHSTLYKYLYLGAP